MAQEVEGPLLHKIEAASVRLGIGRSVLYREISTGRLHSVKLGGRRLVSESALLEYVELLG